MTARARGKTAALVSRAEGILDELDDHALRTFAVERLRPSAAQGQHGGEGLVAGGDDAPVCFFRVLHLEADVGEAVIALADGDGLALRRQPLEQLDVVAP